MKQRLSLFITLFTITLLFANFTSEAQTKKEKKQTLKELKGKAVKDAKKQAKALKKEGYTVIPGDLPMDMQIENSFFARLATDDNGDPKFFVAYQQSKGETFAAAKQAAYQLCLADIASQIGSEILGRIKSTVSNSEGMSDATSATQVIASYQNNVSARLGRTQQIVMLKKVDKLTYVTLSLKYPIAEAERIVKEDLRKKLESEANLGQEEINSLLDIR
ncbi:hypothetical protein [Flammeovirga pacifica]|uniref:Uncharacterized protein n=1 Tax=Flammeovirga pacifica TaxID=915059 RepID=A0A1S1YTS8_FLAPC|nr:hypothetical protein [Flammeovirga pacifica]OHX64205.1 hypothetical protein NH26_21615 [Flammeovirga pacifica]